MADGLIGPARRATEHLPASGGDRAPGACASAPRRSSWRPMLDARPRSAAAVDEPLRSAMRQSPALSASQSEATLLHSRAPRRRRPREQVIELAVEGPRGVQDRASSGSKHPGTSSPSTRSSPARSRLGSRPGFRDQPRRLLWRAIDVGASWSPSTGLGQISRWVAEAATGAARTRVRRRGSYAGRLRRLAPGSPAESDSSLGASIEDVVAGPTDRRAAPILAEPPSREHAPWTARRDAGADRGPAPSERGRSAQCASSSPRRQRQSTRWAGRDLFAAPTGRPHVRAPRPRLHTGLAASAKVGRAPSPAGVGDHSAAAMRGYRGPWRDSPDAHGRRLRATHAHLRSVRVTVTTTRSFCGSRLRRLAPITRACSRRRAAGIPPESAALPRPRTARTCAIRTLPAAAALVTAVSETSAGCQRVLMDSAHRPDFERTRDAESHTSVQARRDRRRRRGSRTGRLWLRPGRDLRRQAVLGPVRDPRDPGLREQQLEAHRLSPCHRRRARSRAERVRSRILGDRRDRAVRRALGVDSLRRRRRGRGRHQQRGHAARPAHEQAGESGSREGLHRGARRVRDDRRCRRHRTLPRRAHAVS